MHLMKVRAPAQKHKATKITKAKQAQWESDWVARNKWLKSLGLPKITLTEYIDELHGRVKPTAQSTHKVPTMKVQAPHIRETPHYPSLVTTSGSCTKPPPKVYTGTAMIGIGQMHKSNAVPIFSQEEAIDISKMRRS